MKFVLEDAERAEIQEAVELLDMWDGLTPKGRKLRDERKKQWSHLPVEKQDLKYEQWCREADKKISAARRKYAPWSKTKCQCSEDIPIDFFRHLLKQ